MCRFIKLVLKPPAIVTGLFLMAMLLINSTSIIAYAGFLFWRAKAT